jgi:hypothetical protein
MNNRPLDQEVIFIQKRKKNFSLKKKNIPAGISGFGLRREENDQHSDTLQQCSSVQGKNLISTALTDVIEATE